MTDNMMMKEQRRQVGFGHCLYEQVKAWGTERYSEVAWMETVIIRAGRIALYRTG